MASNTRSAYSRGRNKSKRATPYSLRSRPTGGDALSAPTDFEVSDRQLDVWKRVVGKTWQLHCVSPLHQFDWSKLRTYSHQLFSQLLSGSASSASIGIRCTVKLSVVLHCGQDDNKGLQIEIYESSKRKGEPLISAILCSLSSSSSSLLPTNEFTTLPLMIVKGTSWCISFLCQWFEVVFDCCITPLRPTSDQLSMLASHYASIELVGRNKKVIMTYSFPEAVHKAGLSSMNVELPWDTVEAIQKRDSDLSIEEKRRAMLRYLSEQVTTVTHFKLEKLVLSRVTVPSCTLDSEGRVKFNTANHIIAILSFLLQ